MKQQRHIPTFLATAVLVAVGTVALAQQESQSTPGQTSTSAQSQQGQTFEGRLVPLYQVLSKGASGMTPSSTTPSSTTPGSSQSPSSSQQPSSLSALASSPPLALIVESGAGASSSTPSRSASEPSSTPGTPGTPGSATRSSSSAMTGQGQIYILVFDPSDQQSQSAYQMAQSIARMSTAGFGRTPSTPTTPGTTDREPVRERESSAMNGEKVKVTGRVLQHEGIKAIAVQKVERKSSSQGGSESQPGSSSDR